MDLLQIALDPARRTRKRTPQTLCENLGNQEYGGAAVEGVNGNSLSESWHARSILRDSFLRCCCCCRL